MKYWKKCWRATQSAMSNIDISYKVRSAGSVRCHLCNGPGGYLEGTKILWEMCWWSCKVDCLCFVKRITCLIKKIVERAPRMDIIKKFTWEVIPDRRKVIARKRNESTIQLATWMNISVDLSEEDYVTENLCLITRLKNLEYSSWGMSLYRASFLTFQNGMIYKEGAALRTGIHSLFVSPCGKHSDIWRAMNHR